ncbi:MFS transporter [Streptomyces sp. TR06-5]|uniref:MFS transporter n=1 Tax=unclassified Streptomyces TaxID=2593676 RepID=UPI00399EFFEE
MTTPAPPPRTRTTADADRASAPRVPAARSTRSAQDAPPPGAAAAGRRVAAHLGSRLAARVRHPVGAATVTGAVLHLLWLWLVANGGGDLAAQDAWAEFVGRHPGSAYNLAWYGGMHPVSYSILSPYLMAVVGVRPTLILSGVLSAGLLALLLTRSRAVARPMVPALWGAFAFACNAASGRVTYALGTLFALGAVAAVWAWPRRWRHRRKLRGAVALLLSALATAGSPVAGLFLEVVAGALLLQGRPRPAVALGAPLPVVVGISALLFPFQGVQPMPWPSVVFPLVTTAAVRLLAPREWRTVRRGAEVYFAGILLTWAVPSQVGSNVERLAQIFGGVLLLALLPRVRATVAPGGRRLTALVCAFVVTAGFQVGKPLWDVVHTRPEAAWAHSLAPLLHRLQQVDADAGRVEVVPVRSHREASALAPYVNLARGWNRQADAERNPLFYREGGFSPQRYHDWLRRWAVHYVVLPVSDTPDVAARQEARLVASRPPFLDLVWQDANWRLYAVADTRPLASSPATSVRAAAGRVTLEVEEPGSVLLRVPWSPWLGLVTRDGDRVAPPTSAEGNVNGCLRRARPLAAGPPGGVSGPPTHRPGREPAGSSAGGAPAPGGNDGPDGADEGPLGLLASAVYEEGSSGRWTVLEVPRAGTYRVAAPYRLPRGTPCPQQDSGGAGGS